MKVGLIADTFSVEAGTGIARYNVELQRGLINRGVEVVQICPKRPDIPFGDAVKHVFKMPYHLLNKRNDIDIFHATSPINALYFGLLKKPNVVTYHDLSSMIYRHGKKSHVSFAAPYFYKFGTYSDIVLADSSQTKDELLKHLKCPEEKISVVNLGVDERFKPITNNKNGNFTIGYIGTLYPRKRLDYLITAFNILLKKYGRYDAKLAICGKKDSEYSNLVDLVQKFKIDDNVEFRGSIPDDELVTTYNSFDVFVLPSEYEGFGIPVLEAHRCNIPVIVRNDVHIPDEVSRHCLKAKSEEDMAKIIDTLISDNSFSNELTKSAMAYSTDFTWDRCVKKTIEQYERILQSSR